MPLVSPFGVKGQSPNVKKPLPQPQALTELDRLPYLLTIKEVAALYRISTATIRRGLQNGTFNPRPWDRNPYRWRRPDIIADLSTRRPEQPTGGHGFASPRMRAARAALGKSTRRNPVAS